MPNNNIYVGERYIPIYDGFWSNTKEYESLTIVTEPSSNSSYISRRPVPAGTPLTNSEYWALQATGNQDLDDIKTQLNTLQTQMTGVTDSVSQLAEKTDDLEAKDTTQDTNIASNTTNIGELTTELNEFKTSVNGSLTELQNADTGFNTRITELEAEISNAGGHYAWKLASDYGIEPGVNCYDILSTLTANDYVAFPAGQYQFFHDSAASINCHCYFMTGARFQTQSAQGVNPYLFTFTQPVIIDENNSGAPTFNFENVRLTNNRVLKTAWFPAGYQYYFEPIVSYIYLTSNISLYEDVNLSHEIIFEGAPGMKPVIGPAASNYHFYLSAGAKFINVTPVLLNITSNDNFIFDNCTLMRSNDARIIDSSNNYTPNYYFKNCLFSKYTTSAVANYGIFAGKGRVIVDGCKTEKENDGDNGGFITASKSMILNSTLNLGISDIAGQQHIIIDNSTITAAVGAVTIVNNSILYLTNGTLQPSFRYVCASELHFTTKTSYGSLGNSGIYLFTNFYGEDGVNSYSHTITNEILFDCSYNGDWNITIDENYCAFIIDTIIPDYPDPSNKSFYVRNKYNPIGNICAMLYTTNGIWPYNAMSFTTTTNVSFWVKVTTWCDRYELPTSVDINNHLNFEIYPNGDGVTPSSKSYDSTKKMWQITINSMNEGWKYFLVRVTLYNQDVAFIMVMNTNNL